jgi:hypothetical protein
MSEKEILNYQVALQKNFNSRLLKSGYSDIESFLADSGLSKHLNMHNVNAASDIARIRVPKKIIVPKSGDRKLGSRLVRH